MMWIIFLFWMDSVDFYNLIYNGNSVYLSVITFFYLLSVWSYLLLPKLLSTK